MGLGTLLTGLLGTVTSLVSSLPIVGPLLGGLVGTVSTLLGSLLNGL